ncbi:CHASE2 domain-containing protein [bacterium]|nr:CHASE2 domain-containing protein [bacterium]
MFVWTRIFKSLRRSLRPLTQVWEKTTLVLLGALTLTAILIGLDFNFLEANLYDLRVSRGAQFKADPKIVIVAIDDVTLKVLDEFAPLGLDEHTRFIEALERLGPRAVGYLVDFTRVHEGDQVAFEPDYINRFVESVKRMEVRGIPFILGTPFDVTGEVVPPYPISTLKHSIAVIHKDGNVFAEDKVTRRALLRLYGLPSFHLALSQAAGWNKNAELTRGSFYVPEVDGDYFFFRYHGNTKFPGVPGMPAPGTNYPIYSFVDLMEGKVPSSAIRDKVVLVGTMSKDDSGDYALTPYSSAPFTNPKLLVHAAILDSIIHNEGVVRAPSWINWFVTFAVTSFVFFWVLTFTPLQGLFATLSLSFFFLVFSLVLYSEYSIWLRSSQPLLGIFLAYYLGVPYRLIREYKKRWDYQRKNEVLLQVEELKTNFLQLVTHDLKTPVARIQGLTEVLIKKAGERLVDRDRETLGHILSSTDELNRFISSILELNKVESDRIQLNRESKDINQIIEKSVEGFKAKARSLQIQMTSNLEPLFPIKIDVVLISKVLNNLIDNALKYSPAGSEVVIESKELDDWVEISVKDQGIGLSEDEKISLFTRFYRAKNEKTAEVAGTGLGLYLTKYFIEAHHGRVEVESHYGQGSTFKILLPLQPGDEIPTPGLADQGSVFNLDKRTKEAKTHV